MVPILTPIYNYSMTPIHLHADNPHYLAYKGQPLLLITSAEHYGAVINREFDYLRYLDTMAQQGMNYTRLFAGSYLEKVGAFGIRRNTLAPEAGQFLAPWARSAQPGYANGGNRFDLDQWDEAYFTRLKDFIERAGRRGIVVELTLFSSIYADDNWQVCPFHPDNNVNASGVMERSRVHSLDNGALLAWQEKLVRKLVGELNEFDNLIFEIQNEPWSDHGLRADSFETADPTLGHTWQNQVDVADEPSLAWQARVADWIVSQEAGLAKRHLIAQNYCNFRAQLTQVDERVSVLNFHYAWPEAALWNYGFDRVVNFDKSGFAGSEDEAYRRQAWRFILAGGGVFNNLDYSFFVGSEDGLGQNQAPGGGSQALRAQLRALREFVSRYSFVDMRPEGGMPRGVSLLRGSREALAYLEGGSALSLTLLPGDYHLDWLDPLHGEILGEQTLACGEHGLLALDPPVKQAELAVGIRPA